MDGQMKSHSDILTFPLGSALPPDCDSHCKASKGKMKITMKKYCKKDFGEYVQGAR